MSPSPTHSMAKKKNYLLERRYLVIEVLIKGELDAPKYEDLHTTKDVCKDKIGSILIDIKHVLLGFSLARTMAMTNV